MSSDYIPRLRAELLRAGAVAPVPRRRAHAVRRLRPLAAAVAVCLLVAVLVSIVPGGHRDAPTTDGTLTLTYRVPTGDATRVAQILRERLSAAGITAEVSAGDRTLTIAAPAGGRTEVTTLASPGRLAIYDWERSVLGPDGRPAPADPAVTGGTDAGHAAALTEAEARARAATRSGARAVEADGGWFAVAGAPALTNADVASSRAAEEPVGGGPTVALSLTPSGRQAFTALTRELARRGSERPRSGDPLQTSQHLAIVLDDRIVATPYVNWREAPNGIDGRKGVSMPGFPTPRKAQLTAALLSAGPFPVVLQP
jgi:preprotein translocase subunit SecD